MEKVMSVAWQFVKRNGYTKSKALKCAWSNMKLKMALKGKVVEFFFKKTDGTIRQAFGTLSSSRIPETSGSKKSADSVQPYFDCEKSEWRCFKKCNLVSIS